MRICHITINPIDYERRIINQAYSGWKVGYQVWIIALGKPGQKVLERRRSYILWRLKTVFYKGGPLKFFHYNLKLIFMLFSKPFDIIHCHDLWVLPAAAILKKIRNGRLVYDAHEYYAGLEIFLHTQIRKKMWLLLERHCMAHIDRLITVSQALGDQYRKHYVSLRQVNIILNVPKFESIPHVASTQTLKDAREMLVVFHGHFKPGRGLENLIQAVKIVSGVKLLLIGGGEIENGLRKIVQDEGLNYRVSFQNYIPTSELISTSAQADIGAVLFEPSSINYKYALPNKFFEYIMAGLPILASDIDTLRYYIMKYDIGVTVNPCDIEAIADSITKMKSDKQQFQKWKMNTLRAAKDLNWENEESKLIDIYQRISD